MKWIHHFSAGPAVLPVEVLEEASRSVLEINGSEMSILHKKSGQKERVRAVGSDKRVNTTAVVEGRVFSCSLAFSS
jgi:phosphoserine aminotransferase